MCTVVSADYLETHAKPKILKCYFFCLFEQRMFEIVPLCWKPPFLVTDLWKNSCWGLQWLTFKPNRCKNWAWMSILQSEHSEPIFPLPYPKWSLLEMLEYVQTQKLSKFDFQKSIFAVSSVGDKIGESLGGSQAPPSFWKVPGTSRRLPRSSLTSQTSPEVPRTSPEVPWTSPKFSPFLGEASHRLPTHKNFLWAQPSEHYEHFERPCLSARKLRNVNFAAKKFMDTQTSLKNILTPSSQKATLSISRFW